MLAAHECHLAYCSEVRNGTCESAQIAESRRESGATEPAASRHSNATANGTKTPDRP